MFDMDFKKWASVVVAAINVVLVWYAVSYPMNHGSWNWHYSLNSSPYILPKPFFAVVWPALFFMTFLALAHMMMELPWFSSRLMYAKITYWVNAGLCIWRSYAYWTLQNISLAYFLTLAIFLYSFVMAWAFNKASKLSGLLVVPTVLWYGYMTYLSWYVWMNN